MEIVFFFITTTTNYRQMAVNERGGTCEEGVSGGEIVWVGANSVGWRGMGE